MSSILDALKKSEAERQRGLPPTIGSSLPFRRPPPPRRRARWWLPVVAVAAVALAWAGGLFDIGGEDSQQDAPPVAADDQAPVQTAANAPRAEAPAPAAPTPESGATPQAQAPQQASAAGKPEQPSTLTDADAVEPAPQVYRGFGPPRPATPIAKQQTPSPTARAATDTATPPPAPQATTDGASQPEPAKVAAAPPARDAKQDATEPAAQSTATAASPAAADDTGIPTIYELPFAARRTLPEITVTMHMFSDDPERRFALINGVRARDGQALEGGVEVVRVLPDGVQLRFESTEFILPVRH